MTVSKAKTTKAKAVKTTTSKAVATEPSPAAEHVVSTVTITPEVQTPTTTARVVTAPVVTAPAVTAPAVTAPVVTAVAVVTPQQVAARAYEIWQSVSYEHGHDVEHWLAAEKELKQAVK